MTPSQQAAPVQVHQLTVEYVSPAETVVACDHVDLVVAAGELVWIRGASGSGKSTLLSAVSGVIDATSGFVQVLGERVTGRSHADRARLRLTQIGVVHQDPLLVEEFSAIENVMLPLEANSWSRAEALPHAQKQLKLVGLEGLEDRRPASLSGGQRQRVAIARALVGDRRVILFDEPTGSLDSQTSRQIFELLKDLSAAGCALLIASHDPSIEPFTDSTYEMQDGALATALVGSG